VAHFDEPGAWSRYNATQVARLPRPLARTLLEHAGPGEGRLALDLGFGAGVETALLLSSGWRVLAIDGDPAAGESLRSRLPAQQVARLDVSTRSFAALDALPAVDLVHAAWSLPYAGRHLRRLWDQLLTALVPGGWLACDLFGERDTTADADDVAVLTDAEVEQLLGRLDVVDRLVQEQDGTSFDGPHHWHVHSVVARRRPD
jgi:trans-aconitate methyltransferase